MRKLFQIFILILCFVPLFISAGTFEDGKNIANKYMRNNFEEDYSKYIISEDTKYGFSEDGIFSVSGFSKGGLINKYEFDISKTNSDDSSWLYDMNGYWSLTGDNDNAYVIGKSAYPKTDVYNNRIVEYVRNKTRVTGKGTYSNPWVIDKSYQVIIKANREKLINSIYINNNKCGEDRCETNIIMNRDAVFYINFKDGYEYDTSEGGANLCNAAGYSPTLKKLVISNVVNDVECFFKVKEKEYEITFNANGGILNEENSKKVTYTKSYGTLPEPTREGYVFTGWYTEQVNGDRIDSSSILDKPEAKTLYAHWSPKSYTVIFDGNNGTPSYSNKTVVYDSKYGTLPTATRTGYTFLGWFTAISGGTQITKDTTVKITSTQTLYAHWKVNTYTVTFNGNGGSVSGNKTKNMTYDTKYDFSGISVTRTGYTFSGWYTAASGGTQVTANTVLTTATNHDLYAHWTATTYTITYNLDGGTVSSNPSTYNINTETITLNNPTKAGYTFKGWTGSNGSAAQTIVTIPKGSTGNKTYTANFTLNQVAVTINGAVSETITIKSGGTTVATVTTGSNAKATLNIKTGTYTFTSNVAKSTTNVNSYYSKSVTITSSTNTINFYPDGAVYWFGNGNYSGQSLYEKFGGIGGGNVNTVDQSDHWGPSTNSFNVYMVSYASTIYWAYANSKKAFSTIKPDGSKYTKLKSISKASGDYNEGGYNSHGKWCYYYGKGLMSYSIGPVSKKQKEISVKTSMAIHSIDIPSNYTSIYYRIDAGAGACFYRRSGEEVITYAVWME